MTARQFEPDFLYDGTALHKAARLTVDAAGRICAQDPAAERIRLPGTVILPGLVNAHSHAFQRTIRGRTEHRVKGRESDDFWTWREQMYGAALSLSPDELAAASRMAFVEMLLSGITAVGEFHYLHRDPKGAAYADPNELSLRVIDAADGLGLRIRLLRVAYQRAGFNVAPNPRQVRFIEGPEAYAKNVEALHATVKGRERVGVGIAPHSVRAVPPEQLKPLAQLAAKLDVPLHIHAAEQPAEIEACLAESKRRPVELLEGNGLLSPRTTLVHAIHLNEGEIAAIGRDGANVCACPSTERNLGDGIVPADALLASGATVSLGTDSQATIDLLEDARELDYHLRLKHLKRAVLDVPGDEADRSSLGRRLFSCASASGARSLALPTGTLREGAPADFLVVSLDDPSIAGANEADLLGAIAFTLGRSAIRSVFVGGREVVKDGRHAEQDAVVRDFQSLQRRLWRDA